MNIKTIIKNIISSLDEPPSFFHGSKDFQNLQADGDVLTNGVAYLDEPIISNDTLYKSGYIKEEYPISILWAKKSAIDYTPAQHDVIIAEMRIRANKFIVKAQADNDNIAEIKNSKKTEVINLFDLNLTGIFHEMIIVPVQTDSVCDD